MAWLSIEGLLHHSLQIGRIFFGSKHLGKSLSNTVLPNTKRTDHTETIHEKNTILKKYF